MGKRVLAWIDAYGNKHFYSADIDPRRDALREEYWYGFWVGAMVMAGLIFIGCHIHV